MLKKFESKKFLDSVVSKNLWFWGGVQLKEPTCRCNVQIIGNRWKPCPSYHKNTSTGVQGPILPMAFQCVYGVFLGLSPSTYVFPCSPIDLTAVGCIGTNPVLCSWSVVTHHASCVGHRLLPSWPLVKILTGPLHFRVTLDTISRYPEPWPSKILGSEIESN